MGWSAPDGRTLRIVWEFRVRQDRVREFEKHYGGNGTWARFFRRGKGYRETILLRDRDDPGRYMTIDVWDDLESYRVFSEGFAEEYKAIDRRCEALTEEERCVGYFETP
jgi:heme-degrading monooxygenase HmoA